MEPAAREAAAGGTRPLEAATEGACVPAEVALPDGGAQGWRCFLDVAAPVINQGLVRFLGSDGKHDQTTDEVIRAIQQKGVA